jgi:phage baseplate assembly protein W
MATKINPHQLREIKPTSDQETLGVGFAFPLRITESGETKLAIGEDSVKSCIYHISTYNKGDLYGTLSFGGNVPKLLFSVFSGDKLALHEDWLRTGIEDWEPRVTNLRVTAGKNVKDESNTKVVMLIQYTVQPTDSESYTLLPVETE